jgi:hypothetical protein
MKYCGRYSNKIDMKVFDEISILYDRQDEQLLDFLEKYKDHHIILTIQSIHIDDFIKYQEWKKLNYIQEKFPDYNFSVCFKESCRFEEAPDSLQQAIKELKVPFFTGDVVTNFDQLHYLLDLGVSQVYLGEDICFDLRRVKHVCDGYYVKLRAFPNVAQSCIKATPPLKKFFIRPEDVEEYGEIIDVLEFWGPLNRQEILHRIYSRGVWFGDLKEIILDLNLSFDSRRIMPGFAQARKVCERKCMKGRRCDICENIYSISEKLEDKGLIIKHKKNY